MTRPFFRLFFLACLFLSISQVSAQPPDISRWTGSTAFAPPQGHAMGNPLTLSWSIVDDGLIISNNLPSDLRAFLNGIYGSEAVWIPHFQSTFNRWSAVSGLTYVYEPTDSGAWNLSGSPGVRGDVRIGGRPLAAGSSVLASNSFPGAGTGGNMTFNTNSGWYASSGTANNSRGLRNVIAHEHGHGLGMFHLDSNNSAQLMEPFIQLTFDGPQHHDILMAHRGYGDVHEKSFGQLGNGVAARATPLGVIANGGSVSVGNSARTFVVAPNQIDFVSIANANDLDFWSFTVNSAGTISALLEPLGFTYNAGPQNGTQISVNTRTRSDLSLALFDTNGSTLLSFVNNGGLGANELLSFDLTSAGTYFLRVSGASNPDSWAVKTQFYGLSANFAAIPEPTAFFGWTLIFGIVALRRNRSQPSKA
jgi:hypothetical protein